MGFKPKFKVPSFFKSVKYSLSAVNGVFLLTGLLLATAGIVVLAAFGYYEQMITNRFFNIPAFTVATGVFILLASVLGFYGAISQSFYVICAYVVSNVIVLVFEIAIVIAAFALRNDAPSAIRSTMLQSMQQYTSSLEVARVWDELQRDFSCCGVAGRFDYVSSQIPVSCCFVNYGTISPFECTSANAWDTGCAPALGEWLAGKASALAICSLVAMCIQVLLTGASAWFAWRSKHEVVELEK